MIHARHVRHRSFGRLRHSNLLLGFLAVQAARLAATPSALFAQLKAGSTADKVRAQPTPPEGP